MAKPKDRADGSTIGDVSTFYGRPVDRREQCEKAVSSQLFDAIRGTSGYFLVAELDSGWADPGFTLGSADVRVAACVESSSFRTPVWFC